MLEHPSISHYHRTRVAAKVKCAGRLGDNVMSADNQQERLDGNWISGFVDGEGCFHVAINKLSKMTCGYQVLPEFRIVQHERDVGLLQRIRQELGVGVVRRNHGSIVELRVRKLEELNRIVEYFKQHLLHSKKKQDFAHFSDVIRCMNEKKHLTPQGIKTIALLAGKMNRQTIRHLESSETTRQTRTSAKI